MIYANELAVQQAVVTPQAEYPLVYRNLMAVGLLASIYRLHDEADIVSAAVEMTLVDTTQYRMCRAVAQGMGGNSKAAEETLLQHIEANPNDDSAKVALGVAMMLSGSPDWKHWLDNVLATSSDQAAREAASAALIHLTALVH
jgi:hypothetical protein